MRHVTLITTGGTIEKTYDEFTGSLENRRSVVRLMLGRIRLENTSISIVELMSKDSLFMTDDDRTLIVQTVRNAIEPPPPVSPGIPDAGSPVPQPPEACTGVVILHGTDTLSVTGEKLHAELADPRVPVVLTGAMRPFEMKRSDALQNLTESIFATGTLSPGVYAVAHGRALKFPGVVKDRQRGTFCTNA